MFVLGPPVSLDVFGQLPGRLLGQLAAADDAFNAQPGDEVVDFLRRHAVGGNGDFHAVFVGFDGDHGRNIHPPRLDVQARLVARAGLGETGVVNPPDLLALQSGDADAWNAAFDWLWPTAFAVAQLKLQPFLPDEIEDVAIESLEALVEKVRELKTVEELKPLAASIAHHRAVSLLRERFAKKRGEGKTESLDAPTAEGEAKPEPVSAESPLDALAEKELATRLQASLAALKPPQGEILSDFFLHGLRYEEIATKRGVAVGSVGVYLKRGLEALRRIWGGREES